MAALKKNQTTTGIIILRLSRYAMTVKMVTAADGKIQKYKRVPKQGRDIVYMFL